MPWKTISKGLIKNQDIKSKKSKLLEISNFLVFLRILFLENYEFLIQGNKGKIDHNNQRK